MPKRSIDKLNLPFTHFMIILAFQAGCLFFNITEAANLEYSDDFEDLAAFESLDSLQISRLKLLHESKLSVLQGEISKLELYFPSFQAPDITKKELSKFSPWLKKDIEFFFKHYPELLPYRQFLDFTYNQKRREARFQLKSSFNENFNINPVKLKFNILPIPKLSLTGEAVYIDSLARWKKRTVKVSLKKDLIAKIGNYNYNAASGLLYGYLPFSSIESSSIKSNWLESQNGLWNGILLHCKKRKNSFTLASHYRTSEQMLMVNYGYNFKSGKVETAISADKISNEKPKLNALLNIVLTNQFSKLSLNTLISSNSINRYPFQLNLKLFGKSISNNFVINFLPKKYKTNRSSIYRRAVYYLDKKCTAKSPVIGLTETFKYDISSQISVTHFLNLIFNQENYFSRIKNILQVGKKTYLKTISTQEFSEKYQRFKLRTNIKLSINQNFNLLSSHYYYASNSKYKKNSWLLKFNAGSKVIRLIPAIKFSRNNKNENFLKIYSTLKNHFFKNSSGEYRVVYYPLKGKNEKMYVSVNFKVNL